MIKVLRPAALVAVLLACSSASRADVSIFSNQAAFLGAASAGDLATYDFETSSGFPAGNAGAASYVGNMGGVTFVGITDETTLATSGTQAFSGLDIGFSCCFGVGTIDFTGLPVQPYALGFQGLDLIEGEIIRAVVGFDDGTATSYSISLGGEPEFTPIFFGLVDSSRTLRFVQLFGAETATPDTDNRAWLIDDLMIAAVPEPATLSLVGAAVLVVGWTVRRRRGDAALSRTPLLTS